MSYLAPIHRPTSVRHAVQLSLIDPDDTCLVLAKANRLEIYVAGQDGLFQVHSRTIYGKILMLHRLRPSNSQTDHLFIGTDRFCYFTVSWDPIRKQLCTEQAYVDQSEKLARDSATYDRCLIDPSTQYMTLFLHDGIVTVIPLSSKGKRKIGSGEIDELGTPSSTRISALLLRSCTFLHPRGSDKKAPQLALLYEDAHQRVSVSVLWLDFTPGMSGEPGYAMLEESLGHFDDIELGASHLIAIPPPLYGFLVLAQTKIIYFGGFDDSDPLELLLDEPTQFAAWTSVDECRYLLADDFGRLYLLMLETEGDQVVNWKLDNLGQTSQASTLVWMGNGFVFVGSHQGNSQLVNIKSGALEILQSISNIAPILDFTIMDMGRGSSGEYSNEYSSGQARIVTGSGIFSDGSLRSVRSGVGLEEQGVLGRMENAIDIFALSSIAGSEHDDLLIVSFVSETRIFHFGSEGDVEEQAAYHGLDTTEPTILAVKVGDSCVVQITPSLVRLIDFENDMVLVDWADLRGKKIISASVSTNEAILSLDGTEVVTLQLSREIVLQARRRFHEGQVSCVHLSSVCPHVAFIGFWRNAKVSLLQVQDLQIIQELVFSDDISSVPRSLLLERLINPASGDSATLLISAANGEVITYTLDLTNFEFSSRNATALGTQQADLKAIPRGTSSLSSVFAICEHPSLIYGSEKHIIFSAVTAENVVAVCSFNSEFCPGAVALVTSDDIRIALVDTEKTTNVQTLHMGELVRRIAYSPSLKTFGIGTVERQLVGFDEVVTSRFKLTDEVLFRELDAYELNSDELVESVLRAELIEDHDEPRERFVVGTSYVEDKGDDTPRGRILVFAVTKERRLKLITELLVKGACRALGCLEGKIVAALIKTVVVYALRSSRLQKLCSYRTSTAPIDMAIHSPTRQIAIADLMKSVSIVDYHPPEPATTNDDRHQLVETARHFQTAWSTAVARIGDDTWLQSDAEGNLAVLFQDKSALSEDDKRRLRVISNMQLGEMVNRIRPVNIKASQTAPVVPKAFVATVEGGVYLFGSIGQRYLDLLISLQSVLWGRVDSLGDLPFNSFRAYRTSVTGAEEPLRFVDGELVEKFLDLTAIEQDAVVEELGTVASSQGGVEWVRSTVETLRRLH